MKSERYEIIKDRIVWKTYMPLIGGQSCGLITPEVTLTCEDVGFSVSINTYRSALKNKELCLVLFDIYLDEINFTNQFFK